MINPYLFNSAILPKFKESQGNWISTGDVKYKIIVLYFNDII